MLELDNNFRVEMEIVGHFRKIELFQRMQAVGPVAAVKLRQMHAERPVFEERQNTVSYIFIERHAALAGAAVVLHHARAEDGVSLTGDKGMVHMRQDLRSIL